MEIEYRELKTAAEFAALVDLEMIVWQMSARVAVPESIMQAIAHTGGSVIGAFAGGQLIGFALAFLAREQDDIYPWSHMAAVHPAYQSRGIGFQIKQRQRAWALRQGYRRMGWTFDPLQRRNAHFNLRQLGAAASAYHNNFYGEMTDGINAGLPSDRLQIDWQLDTPRTAAHAAGQITPLFEAAAEAATPFALLADDANAPALPPLTWDAPAYRVAIPLNAPLLKETQRDRLLAWQQALRQTLQAAFARGYRLVDFTTQGDQCWYIAQRPPA